MPRDSQLAQLVTVMLDGAFTGKGWQGATLSGSLRGLSAVDALWRPSPGRRCIWDHVLHAAYWKHAILRVLLGNEAGDFDRSPSNWPAPPKLADEKQWKQDRAFLVATHKRLRAAAAKVDAAELLRRPAGRKVMLWQYLCGSAAHDAYHCGQVQLLKRLMRE